MSVILFIVILLVLVLVHEFGHFIVARKSGIKVEEFGFGFPPKLFSFKKGETKYSFNALPLGGFVKILGENPENNIPENEKHRAMINKPKRIQAAVLVAGVLFNLLLAWLLFTIGFTSGMPTSASAVSNYELKDKTIIITGVLKDSPAEAAGIEGGDKIISLKSSGQEIIPVSLEEVQEFVGSRGGEVVEIKVKRNGGEKELSIIPLRGLVRAGTAEEVIPGRAAIGVGLDLIGVVKLNFFAAIWEGLKMTATTTWQTAKALIGLIIDSFRGQADISSLTGPVGIVGVVDSAYKFGLIYLISFTALISINLAVINLFPFPALDGGRLLFLLIEKIKGSPIKPVVANALNAIGFMLLIALMIFITYHDIIKLF